MREQQPLGLAAAQRGDGERDADHRNDRTDDGPGGGVAHRATADDTKSLQGPQRAEQENDDSDNGSGYAHPFTVGAALAMMEV